MYPLTGIAETVTATPARSSVEVRSLSVTLLTDEHTDEVMGFLGERPTQTFTLAGFVRSNGIVSPQNRGVFYGCRDEAGKLQGVALIGHFILFEARSDAVIWAFAEMAQSHKKVHLLLGPQDQVKTFWRYYHEGGQAPRLYCREMLFELRWQSEECAGEPELRLATLDDLELIIPVHARTAFEESGINPLDVDPDGFRERCRLRIERGQSWVLVRDDKLIFKAEIVADTPDVIYLEGVDVDPDERGKGHGSRCMAQLCRELLGRTKSIALLVNEKSPRAAAFYNRAGFKLIEYYDTIFLQRKYN